MKNETNWFLFLAAVFALAGWVLGNGVAVFAAFEDGLKHGLGTLACMLLFNAFILAFVGTQFDE